MNDFIPVPGYEGRYSASSDGVIVAHQKLRGPSSDIALKPQKKRNGYLGVKLYDGSGYKNVRAHRIVCEAFHGPKPSNVHQVNHKNGIKQDNRACNLEWVTQSENLKHAFAIGLKKSRYGDRNNKTKIKYSDVEIIRGLCAIGVRQCTISRLYGISQQTVSQYRRRNTRLVAA